MNKKERSVQPWKVRTGRTTQDNRVVLIIAQEGKLWLTKS